MTVPTIHVAMNRIMADVDGLTKDRTSQGGFAYRGIDDMYNYLHDIFVKHGVFSVPRVTSVVREERLSNAGKTLVYTLLTVEYTFYSADGSSINATVVGEAFDSGDKSASKALAIAHKYALFQVTMLPTLLSDPDQEVHQIVPRDTEVAFPEPPPLATDKQMISIGEFAIAGAINGEMKEYIKARGKHLTQKQADQLISKLKSGVQK